MVEVIHYILERRCPSGGFCFYRLNEPNAEDTYYALNTLKLLCLDIADPQTADFLKSLQHEDGSFQSIESCFYTVFALEVLSETPILSPDSFILRSFEILMQAVDAQRKNSRKLLEHLYFITELLKKRNFKIECNFDKIFKLIDFANDAQSRFYFSKLLLNLGIPIDLKSERNFAQKLSFPLYLDDLFFFVKYKQLLNLKFKELEIEEVEKFVFLCQKRNGGFGRSFQSIATMRDTYYAVYLIKSLMKS